MLRISIIEKHIVSILLIFSIIGLSFPRYFIWAKNLTHPMLALIALCVGLTLKPNNFKNAWKNKRFIIPVLTFKYLFAPTLTFAICIILNIPILYTIGLVTLTCCPAANTGNIMCYLSKGNTAMIVITTITGALISPLITPGIIYLLLHKIVQIKFSDIMLLIITGITIPMSIGIFISYNCQRAIEKVRSVIPAIGIISVSIIVATILSTHAEELMKLEIKLPIICISLITIFLASGYIFSKVIKCSVENSIAMSYEIGTFDGVLGILLVMQIAGNEAVLSVVLFAVLNLIIGSTASKIFNSHKFLAADS